ncbi:hypothetical protein GCM10007092_02280 [Thermus composti]|uniref:Lipoprotein n=1 Tax=Thermus composti TaxID=532059 RepID=A0ABV6PY93_9DEIN|nr:hypothetical protein [Thermus composti]GGM92705.1 hypothetical protein GCM10007092_02280 [Thermus composti]
MKRYLMALALLATACAPQVTQAPPARPELQVEAFYPVATGLEWVYLPEGEPLSNPPYRVRVEGPAFFQGKEVIRFRSLGRGENRLYYREVGGFGVRLLGFEDPSARVVFAPAIPEYPPEGLLAPGYRWGGESQVQVTLLTPQGEKPLVSGRLAYAFEVLETKEVRVPAGTFRVFRIQQRYRDEKGETLYEVWFAPRVGEVRTREGRLLVDRNFR